MCQQLIKGQQEPQDVRLQESVCAWGRMPTIGLYVSTKLKTILYRKQRPVLGRGGSRRRRIHPKCCQKFWAYKRRCAARLTPEGKPIYVRRRWDASSTTSGLTTTMRGTQGSYSCPSTNWDTGNSSTRTAPATSSTSSAHGAILGHGRSHQEVGHWGH